jgi:4'-phosphopantetheinyl transferase
VDVEALPGAAVVADLASVLHPGERAELDALPADRRVAAFAGIWTRKEAYLKGIGTGLGRDPALDYLGGTGLAPAPPGWTVTDLDVGPGHAAAFAVQGVPVGAARLRGLAADFVR